MCSSDLALVATIAPLRALYGPFGAWDAKRKVLLAVCAVQARDEAETKLTEATVNDLAHTADAYRDFIERSEAERVQYVLLDNAITDLTERIHRDNALIRYVTSEPK